MTPTGADLWFLPLGGCGEIGMNLNLYGHAGKWLMVDCGVTFETPEGERPNGDNEVHLPDPSFIADRSEDLLGLIATHVHQDHIGAIHYLWRQFDCPIYATAFTAHVLEAKLRREGCAAPVHVVEPRASLVLGGFQIEWLPITHSTVETSALLIETSAGRVLHTADWKMDHQPVVGEPFRDRVWQQLGKLPPDAVVCDSTNALTPGWSRSEADLYDGLLAEVEATSGRVVVACFASNLARLQTLGDIANKTGRYIGVLGRSLHEMIRSAKACGYLDANFDPVPTHDLGYLPPADVMIIATGSQGEPRAALQRLARGRHPDLELEAGDKVIFSAKTIPGNEAGVARVLRGLERSGIGVVHADETTQALHASGHPCQDELHSLYRWLQPQIAIPVHGEAAHMDANAAIAKESGVPRSMVGSNGDLFRIAPTPSVYRGAVAAGRWVVQPNGGFKGISWQPRTS